MTIYAAGGFEADPCRSDDHVDGCPCRMGGDAELRPAAVGDTVRVVNRASAFEWDTGLVERVVERTLMVRIARPFGFDAALPFGRSEVEIVR